MKRIVLVTGILIAIQSSLYAQVETDRPETFLFEHRNRLQDLQHDLGNTDKTDSSHVYSTDTISREIAYTTYISAGASGFFNSNSISNDFIRRFRYNRTYIDNDLKEQEISRMKSSNRIGSDIKIQLYGQHQLKNKTRLEFGLTYRDFYGAQFTTDAFKLVFYGNTIFAGQYADLSPLSLHSFNYEALYVGARKTLDKQQRVTAGVRLGYIRGNRFQHARFKNTTLYTDPMGSYLSLTGDFDITYNDDTSGAIQRGNGNGLYTDLYFSVKGDRNEFVVEVLDLGFIQWNGMAHYKGNGTYTYTGIPIDNIFSSDGLTVNPISLSSFLDAAGLEKEYKNVTYLLPATLHLAYFRHINPKLTVSAGVRQQFISGYIPRVYAKAAYYIQKNFALIPTLAYGGFGKTDIELGLAKNFNQHLIVSANLFWLEYLAWPKQSSGHGMSVSMSYYF